MKTANTVKLGVGLLSATFAIALLPSIATAETSTTNVTQGGTTDTASTTTQTGNSDSGNTQTGTTTTNTSGNGNNSGTIKQGSGNLNNDLNGSLNSNSTSTTTSGNSGNTGSENKYTAIDSSNFHSNNDNGNIHISDAANTKSAVFLDGTVAANYVGGSDQTTYGRTEYRTGNNTFTTSNGGFSGITNFSQNSGMNSLVQQGASVAVGGGSVNATTTH